jgi:hypothetical protein
VEELVRRHDAAQRRRAGPVGLVGEAGVDARAGVTVAPGARRGQSSSGRRSASSRVAAARSSSGGGQAAAAGGAASGGAGGTWGGDGAGGGGLTALRPSALPQLR